ncbi:MAG: hypothetical protein IMW98_09620, partial [Firmicutes bacterium]|nr:hypothetical protein [Bacillota bacterium]
MRNRLRAAAILAAALLVMGMMPLRALAFPGLWYVSNDGQASGMDLVIIDGRIYPTLKPDQSNPPPIPAPGKGALHVVTRHVTGVLVKTRGPDGTVRVRSLTVPATWTGDGWRTIVAFELWSVKGSLSCPSFQQAVGAGKDPYYVAFDYPTSPDFLRRLQAAGWLDPARIDLSRVGPYVPVPGDLTRQPRAVDAGFATGDAFAHLPGTLYVNLFLSASPGAAKWHVDRWNYVFDVDASVEPCLA